MKRNNTRVLLALSFFCFVGISKAVETEGLVSFQSGNLPILDPFSHLFSCRFGACPGSESLRITPDAMAVLAPLRPLLDGIGDAGVVFSGIEIDAYGFVVDSQHIRSQ